MTLDEVILTKLSPERRGRVIELINRGSYKLAKVFAVQALPSNYRSRDLSSAVAVVNLLEEVDVLIAEREKK